MKKATTQVDQAGGGGSPASEVNGNSIVLPPKRAVGKLARINGVLVQTGEASLEAGKDLVAQSRKERIADLTHRQEV